MEDTFLRLGAALLGGAMIGLERELHDKPAGLRTMILISLGAATYTLVSEQLGETGDRGRVAAQVVTGVGFLGAGVIIQARGAVLGLTTAAAIWMVASIGMAFGAGRYSLGTVATVAATFVLFGLSHVEHWITRLRPPHIERKPDAPEEDSRRL